MQAELRRWQVTKGLPRAISIGKAADGAWATAKLKEYPPAMSGGLAEGFLSALRALPQALKCRNSCLFSGDHTAHAANRVGSYYGPDYMQMYRTEVWPQRTKNDMQVAADASVCPWKNNYVYISIYIYITFCVQI